MSLTHISFDSQDLTPEGRALLERTLQAWDQPQAANAFLPAWLPPIINAAAVDTGARFRAGDESVLDYRRFYAWVDLSGKIGFSPREVCTCDDPSYLTLIVEALNSKAEG